MGLKAMLPTKARRWLREQGRLKLEAARPSSKPIVAIYGNCQAAALKELLVADPVVRSRFRVVALPPTHELKPEQLAVSQRIIGKAHLFLTQPIRDDYRGMPIGSDQLSSLVSDKGSVFSYPSMYFRGLHPYMANVHNPDDGNNASAPLSGYHDLRTLTAASLGVEDEEAYRWLKAFTPEPGALQALYAGSLKELAKREVGLDSTISGSIEALGAESFWTVNHPSNKILTVVVDALREKWGLGPLAQSLPEILVSGVAPVHPEVRAAMGWGPALPGKEWLLQGEERTDEEIIRRHLAWYRLFPRAVEVGMEEHRASREALGLLV